MRSIVVDLELNNTCLISVNDIKVSQNGGLVKPFPGEKKKNSNDFNSKLKVYQRFYKTKKLRMKNSEAEGLWELHELGKVYYDGAALFTMHYLLCKNNYPLCYRVIYRK